MSKSRIIAGGLLILVSALILGACTPGETPAPTVDTNMIFTAAAQTVQAQLSETAAAAPTATDTPMPLEPTAALEVPTLAPVGQQDDGTGLLTATPLFTLAPLPGLATATPGGLPAGPTNVTAQWVSNDPADGADFSRGQKFDVRWTIKNVGTTTWTDQYYIQYAWGDKLTEKSKYYFRDAEVKPDETTTIIADGLAPDSTGEFTSWWKVKDPDGNNIGDLTLTINVEKATATPNLADLCEEKAYYKDHTSKCDNYCADNGTTCWPDL